MKYWSVDRHGARIGDVKTSGPLLWKDKLPWKPELPTKQIRLPLATGGEVVLRLGFYFLWYSEYCVVVEASDVDSRDLPETGGDVEGAT